MTALALTSLLAAGPAGADGGSFWLPAARSTTAGEVDSLFYLILGISLFFFVLIVAVMLAFVLRYRHRRERPAEPSRDHNLPLELTWTLIPVVLVAVIFFYGFRDYLDITTPPRNSYQVQVEAQQWSWSFTYPNGYTDSVLHVPVARPVELVMTSRDVIHSLYIPAFRIKRDVVPGRYAKVWFEATEPGDYDLFCAEYCGTNHSNMITKVVVHPSGEFETWLGKASNFLEQMTPVDAGRKIFQVRGCQQCHSVDGTAKVGPSLRGVFGHQVRLADGSTVTADENYIRQSILEPASEVVAGFDPVMPTFQGRLSDQEITALIAYLKSLDGN